MNLARLQLASATRQRDLMAQCIANDSGSDHLRNFFEACWHIKDHARAALPASEHNRLERDVVSARVFNIVADVANRSKHVILTKSDRTGAAVTFKAISAFGGATPASATYSIDLADGSRCDALQIANEALVEWDRLLSSYGL